MTFFPFNRRALLGAALSCSLPVWAAAPPLPVVASFSILGDLVREVGGELVSVTELVGPDGDAHVFEPTPQQARQLQQARVLVSNGLGFEGWLPRLKNASGFKGQEIVASRGIRPLALAEPGHGAKDHHGHSHARAQDPHAWQDVRNVVVYVKNIEQGLAQADPSNGAYYRARAAEYVARLNALDASLRTRFAALPAERRKVISTHDAFGYFTEAYGLRFVPVRGLSTESEPSARDIARLVEQIRRERINSIFIENISDSRLLEQLARETGAVVGGKLYSDALALPRGLAPTYIDMMETNAATLLGALQEDSKPLH